MLYAKMYTMISKRASKLIVLTTKDIVRKSKIIS